MRRVILALGPLAALLAAPVAHAQQDFPGARALGMGEAMRATASGAEAVILNPSAMSLNKQYVIEAQYDLRAEDLGHHVNVAVTDSVTSRLAAGLFYSFIYSTPTTGFRWAGGQINNGSLTRTGHAAGLALSLALGDRFMIGLTTKYLHFDTTAALPAGTQPSSLSFDSVNNVTWDLGLTVRLGDHFNIAAIGYNLWDHNSQETPTSLGIGLAYVPVPVFSINFDTVINFTGYKDITTGKDGKVSVDNRTTVRLGPGLEFIAGKKVPIRAGLVYDSGLSGHNSTGTVALTVGLGYQSTSFAVDLGYRARVAGGVENFVGFGLRLFVD